PGVVERMKHFVEGVDGAADLVAIVGGDDVVGAGFEGDFHQAVFGHRVGGDEELSGVKKLKRDRAGAGKIAAALGEHTAQFGGGAVFVVGRDLHDEGDPARAISFVGDVFVRNAGQFTGALLDRA